MKLGIMLPLVKIHLKKIASLVHSLPWQWQPLYWLVCCFLVFQLKYQENGAFDQKLTSITFLVNLIQKVLTPSL